MIRFNNVAAAVLAASAIACGGLPVASAAMRLPRAVGHRTPTWTSVQRQSPCPSHLLQAPDFPMAQIQRAVRDYLRTPSHRFWTSYRIDAIQTMTWATWRVYNQQSGARGDAVRMCGRAVTNRSWFVLLSPARPDPKVAYLVQRLYLADGNAGWRVWAMCGPSCFHA